MKDLRKPKLADRIESRRVELVRPTCQLSKTDLEQPITLPQLSLERPPPGSWNQWKFSISTRPGVRTRRDALEHHPQ